MHRNQIWIAFLAVIALIVFWFSSLTLYKIYTFYSLSGQIPANRTTWEVTKLGEDRYALRAHYTYTVKGKEYVGDTILRTRIFRNPRAAEQMLPEVEDKKWVIWYAPKIPSHSAIRKQFPLKELVYTGVLWIIFFYFIWLGYFVGKKNNRGKA